MTEEQKAKYEEAARDHIKKADVMLRPLESIMWGIEHAHPIGFNLGKEEGKKEGWNEAIDAAIETISFKSSICNDNLLTMVNELQKLRK